VPVFPVYNLFVGLAVVFGYLVVERFLHPQDREIWPYQALLALGSGAAGAVGFSRWVGVNPTEGYAFSFLGGFFSAFAVLFGTWTFRRRNVLACLDACALGISIAHGIGRLGCFFGGCCYGRHILIPSIGTFQFPVQLSESMFEGVIFIRLLSLRSSAKMRDGRLAIEWLLWYGSFRFLVEYLRGDHRGSLPLDGLAFTPSQVLSLGLILIAITLALARLGRPVLGPRDR
jgi:phosphatidylglycerol:prolipoprotein diacylglycerol transferase